MNRLHFLRYWSAFQITHAGSALVLALALIHPATDAFGQWTGPLIPESLSFQGQLTKMGVPLDTTLDMTVSLYKGTDQVWTRVINDVVVTNGLFDLTLSSASLDTVAFNRPIDLEVEVGGETLSPRTPLRSSAYALGMRGLYAVPAEAGSGYYSGVNVIGGWHNNYVADEVVGATVAGGGRWGTGFYPDSVVGIFGTVSGGRGNLAGEEAVVAGGYRNRAAGLHSTVSGGWANQATGQNSTVAGGSGNVASGTQSFAAGYAAKSLHDGSLVFQDAHDFPFTPAFESTGPNQFLIRAVGGVGIGTNAPLGILHISSETEGDASVYIEADTDNNNEADNPKLTFLQDGRQAGARLGFDEGIYGSNMFAIGRIWNGSTQTPTIEMETETGHVGIGTVGTSGPTNPLHVVASFNGGATIPNHVALIENKASAQDQGPDVLALKTSTPSASMSVATNFITFFEGGGAAVGSIEGIPGPGISFNTSGADYAEYVPKADPLARFEVGQVVGLGADGLSLVTDGAHRVFVITRSPAVLGNRPIDADEADFAKVALLGQVEVVVRGPVKPGDYVLASGRNDGAAIAKEPSMVTLEDLDRLVGKAWGSSAGAETRVRVEVGLDMTSVMRHIIVRQDDRIGRLEEAIAALQHRTTN